LRTPDLSQQSVLGIKEISRTCSCEPVKSRHSLHLNGTARTCPAPWKYYIGSIFAKY